MAKISLIVFAVLLISQLNLIQFVVMGAPAPEEAATTAAPANPSGAVEGILPVTLPTDILGQSKNLTEILNVTPSNSSKPLTDLGSITSITGNVQQQIGMILSSVPLVGKVQQIISENLNTAKNILLGGTVGTVKPPALFKLPVGQPQIGTEFLTGIVPIALPTVQPPTGQQPTTAQPPAPVA